MGIVNFPWSLLGGAAALYKGAKGAFKTVRKLLWGLLIALYVVLVLFGFLSGMFSEGLIGSTHPWAALLRFG